MAFQYEYNSFFGHINIYDPVDNSHKDENNLLSFI